MEIDEEHGSMLEALREAHQSHQTPTHRLLRTLIHQVDVVRREALLLAGVDKGEVPDPIEVWLPGEKPAGKPKKTLRSVVGRMLRGG